jgi:hypothetical protein
MRTETSESGMTRTYNDRGQLIFIGWEDYEYDEMGQRIRFLTGLNVSKWYSYLNTHKTINMPRL